MKKLIAVLLLVSLLSGCAVSGGANKAETEPTQETAVEQETPVPEPTPIAELTSLELPVASTLNSRVLTDTEESGVYTVMLHEEEVDRPNLPTYCWYINGTNADIINEVVIEFDVFDTVRPLDGKYFGYDQAFYIILHNFDTIPFMPPWPVDYISFNRGDIDVNIMIKTPELGVDLKKYVEREGEHVRIRIPYSEFQNAAKDLTLQFCQERLLGT